MNTIQCVQGARQYSETAGKSYKATVVRQCVHADSVGTLGWVLPFLSGASIEGFHDKNQMMHLFSNTS